MEDICTCSLENMKFIKIRVTTAAHILQTIDGAEDFLSVQELLHIGNQLIYRVATVMMDALCFGMEKAGQVGLGFMESVIDLWVCVASILCATFFSHILHLLRTTM
jgi:hypothetical protein